MEVNEEATCVRRCTKVLYFMWKVFTCIFTHIMLVTMVVGYCLLGAVTFESLEKEYEVFVSEFEILIMIFNFLIFAIFFQF